MLRLDSFGLDGMDPSLSGMGAMLGCLPDSHVRGRTITKYDVQEKIVRTQNASHESQWHSSILNAWHDEKHKWLDPDVSYTEATRSISVSQNSPACSKTTLPCEIAIPFSLPASDSYIEPCLEPTKVSRWLFVRVSERLVSGPELLSFSPRA